MLCKFLSDVKVISLFAFLKFFLIFGPILGTHGIFFEFFVISEIHIWQELKKHPMSKQTKATTW